MVDMKILKSVSSRCYRKTELNVYLTLGFGAQIPVVPLHELEYSSVMLTCRQQNTCLKLKSLFLVS